MLSQVGVFCLAGISIRLHAGRARPIWFGGSRTGGVLPVGLAGAAVVRPDGLARGDPLAARLAEDFVARRGAA